MAISRCPFSWGVFILSTAIVITLQRRQKKHRDQDQASASSSSSSSKTLDCHSTTAAVAVAASSALPNCEVVFVLGAPGTGKGTQCELLARRLFDPKKHHNKTMWTHLSAGDLLREERNAPGSALGDLINAKINAGELVPSAITVQLLENAMRHAYHNGPEGCVHYLIDGFPRGHENLAAWQATMTPQGHTVNFVLNFECPEEVLVGRLLERGKDSGRSDDTLAVIRKRFQTHQHNTVPLLAQFAANTTTPVHTIDSAQSVEQVYHSVVGYFQPPEQQQQ